jgi:hypothetical protein
MILYAAAYPLEIAVGEYRVARSSRAMTVVYEEPLSQLTASPRS